MPSSQHVIDVTEDSFEAEVVERSRQVPVVVDFWAPWCGPCRALGPLLEQFVKEAGGAFVLAKINVDDNQNLAGQFGVNGIPAVFAIRDATIVDRFEGLLPEEALKRFLNGLTPSQAERLVREAVEQEASNPASAESAYRAALAMDATLEVAKVGLARTLLGSMGNEAEAGDLLRGIEVGDLVAEADRLRRVIQLREIPHGDSDLAAARSARDARPELAEGHLRVGGVLAARGQYIEALESLIAAAEHDKKLAAGPVRELMVNIFHIIGVRSPEADTFRDRLQSLLY